MSEGVDGDDDALPEVWRRRADITDKDLQLLTLLLGVRKPQAHVKPERCRLLDPTRGAVARVERAGERGKQ